MGVVVPAPNDQADRLGDGPAALSERGELSGDEVDALLAEEGGAK